MIGVVNLCFFSIVVFVIYYFLKSKRKYNLPPGPQGIPMLGMLSGSGPNRHIDFTNSAKEYGPIMKTQAFFRDLVVLSNDSKIIKEAFNDPALSGRPDGLIGRLFSEGKEGLLNADGSGWVEQRRFVLKTLRDFGFGKQSMESLIIEEAKDFLNWIKSNEGQPVSVNRKFSLAVVNSLWTIMTGQRSDQDDEIAKQVLDRANDALAVVTQVSARPFLIFPKLIDILPRLLLGTWYKVVKAVVPFNEIVQEALDEHIRNPVDDQSPRDLIDKYLTEIRKTTDSNSTFYQEKGLKSLLAIIGDLYLAGSATTSTTLSWSVLYLLKCPTVQAKLQKEIDEIIGKNRLPSIEDRTRMPYVEAFINELLRITSFIPLGVPHEAMEDTKLRGYDIRKGTLIFSNFYSIHHSVEIWGDPENFRPERWLSDKDGHKEAKTENLLAFSIGKRQCIGEGLARDTTFLFLTTIAQRFSIHPDPSKPDPTFEAIPRFLREPKIFNVVFKDRLG